jgi:hypothetical protein
VTDIYDDADMMLELLRQGVPWYLAREAIASTHLSEEGKND